MSNIILVFYCRMDNCIRMNKKLEALPTSYHHQGFPEDSPQCGDRPSQQGRTYHPAGCEDFKEGVQQAGEG